MARGSGAAFRFVTILLIVAKVGFCIGILVLTAQLKTMVLDGIDKFKVAFEAADMQKEKNACEKSKKYINMAYLSILIVVVLFAIFDLIGCAGAAIGNRCILCIFIIITSVFILLIAALMSASAVVARASDNPDNYFVKGFYEFTDQSMKTLTKLYRRAQEKSNHEQVKKKWNLTSDDIKAINDILKVNKISNMSVMEGVVTIISIVKNVSSKIYDAQEAFFWVQKTLECCGVTTYHDWYKHSLSNLVPYLEGVHWYLIHLEDSSGRDFRTWEQECLERQHRIECYVPRSCCKGHDPNCNEVNDIRDDVKNKDQIFTEACRDALINKIHNVTKIMGILLGFLLILMIISVITACIVRRQLKEEKEPIPPPIERRHKHLPVEQHSAGSAPMPMEPAPVSPVSSPTPVASGVPSQPMSKLQDASAGDSDDASAKSKGSKTTSIPSKPSPSPTKSKTTPKLTDGAADKSKPAPSKPGKKGVTEGPLVKLAKPQDDTSSTATGATTSQATEATSETTTAQESSSTTSASTVASSGDNDQSSSTTTTRSPPASGGGGGGRPPRVRPSGYSPNQQAPSDNGFGVDDIDSPSPSYQAPSPYGGGGQAPRRRGPSIPTGFDQATWGNWGPWGPCTCGKRARTRACDYSTAYLTEGCDGNSYELQPCSGAPCGIQGGCGPAGCGGGGGYGGGGGCSGSGCVLQGGPPTTGGCSGGACGAPYGSGPVLVQPPFPYPPVPPGIAGCSGSQCGLQGGPSGGCSGGSCGSPDGYAAPAPPPPPPPSGYGQPSGCSGSSCVLQGGPSGGCVGGSCNPSPILPPIVGGGCAGGGCGQPNPPSGYAPSIPSSGYGSSGPGCSGGGCVLQGGTGTSGAGGCNGDGCILTGSGGPIMIKPGGSNGYASPSGCSGDGCGAPISGCSGGGCGAPAGGYAAPAPPPPPPPPPSGYGGGGCSGGDCVLQGGPAGGISGGCGAGGCGPILPPIVPSAPAPGGYGSAPSGCSGGGCALQGGIGVPSGCGSGSYGSSGCQNPPSYEGAPYKALPPLETIRMDGVMQPVANVAPPGLVATNAPAYGAPAPSYNNGPSSYSGQVRNEDAPSPWKRKAGSLVDPDADDDKSAPERTRRKRRLRT